MRIGPFIATLAMVAGLGACQTTNSMSVADYCADPSNGDTHVCQLEMDINGTKTSLAQTDMSVGEARSIADRALRAAAVAQRTADNAQSSADEARSMASAALRAAQAEDLKCETRTIQKTDTGTCQPGYALMSCTQTRYTHRAGGLSFLREIDDEKCRFNSRVLEMQVRCCAAIGATPANAQPINMNQPESVRRVDPVQSELRPGS